MKLKILSLVSLGFVILYNLLFFQTQNGIGLTLQYLLLQLFFYLIRDKNSHNLDFAIISSSLSVLFALLSGFRANEFVLIINLLLALLFSTIALFFYKYQPRFHLTIPGFLLIPLTSFVETLSSVADLVSGKERDVKTSSDSQLTSSIVRGGLMALFFCGVLFFLLMNADFVFAKLVGDFFANIWERLFVSILVFVALMLFGLTQIKKLIVEAKQNVELVLKKGKVYELSIILISVIALFMTFIIVQFRYLFLPVGEMELREIGINSATYSEYVRAGFFELLTASVLVGGLIIYLLRFIDHLKDKERLMTRVLTSVLILETLIIQISASKRLSLYAEAHGLTRAREFGFIFLVWLGLMMVFLLFRVLKNKTGLIQTVLVMVTTILMFLSINLINLDKLITTKYYPTVNGEVDYLYLVNLSTDGVDSWVPALSQAESLFNDYLMKDQLTADENRKFILTRMTLQKLDSRNTYLLDKYGPKASLQERYQEKEIPKDILIWRKWQSLNFSEYLAYKYLIENHQSFEKVARLLELAGQIEAKVTDEVKAETKLDRSTNAPLIRD